MGEIYRNNSLLSNYPPCLRENISELCLKSQTGLSSITFTDITVLTPHRNSTKTSLLYGYHFGLRIPYAGKFLKWELIFNPEDYAFAPDFDFNDDYFFARPDVDTVINKIPSLVTWNIKDPKSLSSVLKELLAYFKETQLQRLQNENIFSRIHSEYTLLTCEDGVAEKDVEVLIDNNVVHFLVRFKVDYSALPEYLQPPETEDTSLFLNPGEDYANLRISFMKPDGSRVTPALQLSPRLEQVLGGRSLHIPPYTKETSLVEYVPHVSGLLKERIEGIVLRHRLRKEYVTCLTTVRQYSVVEYDADTFSKVAIICEVDEYFCLVQIEVSEEFPAKKPKVTLCSLYCMDSKTPCTADVDDYPYSPRWTCDEMIQRLLGHLVDAIPKFKLHKH